MVTRFEMLALEVMATEHVTYEIDRLSLWSSVVVDREFFRIDDDALKNIVFEYVRQATLETALLHLRCITEFLVEARPKGKHNQRDLRADDYFDSGWANRPRHVFGLNHQSMSPRSMRSTVDSRT